MGRNKNSATSSGAVPIKPVVTSLAEKSVDKPKVNLADGGALKRALDEAATTVCLNEPEFCRSGKSCLSTCLLYSGCLGCWIPGRSRHQQLENWLQLGNVRFGQISGISNRAPCFSNRGSPCCLTGLYLAEHCHCTQMRVCSACPILPSEIP